MNTCPKCSSDDVAVGCVVLECFQCGWNHLNEYPCDVCGQPSFSSAAGGSVTIHRCREHPMTDADVSKVFQSFLKANL